MQHGVFFSLSHPRIMAFGIAMDDREEMAWQAKIRLAITHDANRQLVDISTGRLR